MTDRPLWFDGCLIGAIFALLLTPASADTGLFLVNLVALACFLAPVIATLREGGPGTDR